jgi:hypothetical protein
LVKLVKAPAVASDSIEPLDVKNTTKLNTEVYLRRFIYKFLLKDVYLSEVVSRKKI